MITPALPEIRSGHEWTKKDGPTDISISTRKFQVPARVLTEDRLHRIRATTTFRLPWMAEGNPWLAALGNARATRYWRKQGIELTKAYARTGLPHPSGAPRDFALWDITFWDHNKNGVPSASSAGRQEIFQAKRPMYEAVKARITKWLESESDEPPREIGAELERLFPARAPYVPPPESDEMREERIEAEDAKAEETRERLVNVEYSLPETVETAANLALEFHDHTSSKHRVTTFTHAWRHAYDGPRFHRPVNIYRDGRAFAKKGPGGSIAIDLSGSMHWDWEYLKKQCARFPNLYVIAYGVSLGNRATGFVGEHHKICIIAKGGRVGEFDKEKERFTVANGGADLVAMRHIVKVGPPPHIMLSDGYFVDVRESSGMATPTQPVGADYMDACNAIARRYRVATIETIDHAFNYLRGKEVPGWWGFRTEDPERM